MGHYSCILLPPPPRSTPNVAPHRNASLHIDPLSLGRIDSRARPSAAVSQQASRTSPRLRTASSQATGREETLVFTMKQVTERSVVQAWRLPSHNIQAGVDNPQITDDPPTLNTLGYTRFPPSYLPHRLPTAWTATPSFRLSPSVRLGSMASSCGRAATYGHRAPTRGTMRTRAAPRSRCRYVSL